LSIVTKTVRAELPSSFPVGRYVVFYQPQDDGVEVVRVLHSARDIESIAEDGGFAA